MLVAGECNEDVFEIVTKITAFATIETTGRDIEHADYNVEERNGLRTEDFFSNLEILFFCFLCNAGFFSLNF